jgi:hypothetical protein
VGQVTDPSADNPTPILDDLDAAFCNSPDFFQTHLLGLTAIYVNPTDCASGNAYACTLPGKEVIGESWGFRERPAQYAAGMYPASPGRYIAISAGLWKGGNAATDLATYETQLLNRLLKWPGGNQPSFGATTSPNTSWMTALAALAHELGHVRWYDVNVPDPSDGGYDFTILASFCPDAKPFFTSSWNDLTDLQPPRWRGFAERQNKHKGGHQVSQIDNSIAKGNFTNAGAWLAEQYARSSPWASLFGAISPDEDFVETYVFNVLTRATPPLTMLPLNLPNGSTVDVVTDYRSNEKDALEFGRKVTCVYNTKNVLPWSLSGRRPFTRYR